MPWIYLKRMIRGVSHNNFSELNHPTARHLIDDLSLKGGNEKMHKILAKHNFNVLVTVCIIGCATLILGIVALQQQGFILIEIGNSSLLIDGTKGEVNEYLPSQQ